MSCDGHTEVWGSDAPTAPAGGQGPEVTELARLRAENRALASEKARALAYIREKVNQLLGVMGTIPLRAEELDDATLLDLDPIGIVGEAFAQVLANLHDTNRDLRVAHREIEIIFDSAGVGILVLDPNLKILASNRQARDRLLNGSVGTGKRCYEAVCGRGSAPEVCTLQQTLALKKPVRRQDWTLRSRHYDVLATPILDDAGDVAQVVLAYLDISERQESARALAESEERYRDLFENAHDLIQSVAPDGSFIYVNRAWLETLGYTAAEVPRLSMFDVIAPECREHCQGLFRDILAGKDVGHFEVTFQTKDGRAVLLEGTTNCKIENGTPLSTRGIFRDVTQSRQMEVEAARAQQLESLGGLAGGIAHDFNNMLTAILGNLTLARLRSPPEGEVVARLEEAERATLRARDLTQQLLTFSRGGAPVRREVHAEDLAAEAARFALAGSSSECVVKAADGLWSAELDPAQVGQVIQNLVLNADQSMPDGGKISVWLENEEVGQGSLLPLAPGRYVRIAVTDEGAGILPEHATRVFDPYFTTKPSGTGLGLATAFSIVQRHAGHLTFTSRVGHGTTFSVYLPATGRLCGPLCPDPDPPSRGGGRVLLMDDEEMIRAAAGDMLEFLGYRVEMARDGEEALQMYQERQRAGERFDAVVMDLTVPGGMGGREAAERLLALDSEARIVASSGYSNDPIMAEPQRYGFCGVAAKPYRLDTIAAVLRDAVSG